MMMSVYASRFEHLITFYSQYTSKAFDKSLRTFEGII